MGDKAVQNKREELRALAASGASGLDAYRQGIEATRSSMRDAIDFALDGSGARHGGSRTESSMLGLIEPYGDAAIGRLYAGLDAHRSAQDGMGSAMGDYSSMTSEIVPAAYDLALELAKERLAKQEAGAGGGSLSQSEQEAASYGQGLEYRTSHLEQMRDEMWQERIAQMDDMIEDLPLNLRAAAQALSPVIKANPDPAAKEKAWAQMEQLLGEFSANERKAPSGGFGRVFQTAFDRIVPGMAEQRYEAEMARIRGAVPEGVNSTLGQAAFQGSQQANMDRARSGLQDSQARRTDNMYMGLLDQTTPTDSLTGQRFGNDLIAEYLSGLYDNDFAKQAYVDLGFGDALTAEGLFNPLYGGDDPVSRAEQARERAFFEEYGIGQDEYDKMLEDPDVYDFQSGSFSVPGSVVQSTADDIGMSAADLAQALPTLPGDVQGDIEASVHEAVDRVLSGESLDKVRREVVGAFRANVQGAGGSEQVDVASALLANLIEARIRSIGLG